MRRLLGLVAPCRRGRRTGWRYGRRRGRFGGLDLHELPLHHRAKLREIRAARADQSLNLVFEPPRIRANALDVLLDLRAGFTHQQLRFPIGLLADLRAELLRGHEGVVEGLVAFAKRPELLHEPLGFLLEILVEPDEPLQLSRDLIAKRIDARLVIPAQCRSEIVAADVERCQMKGFVAHALRVPNRMVPSLTIVAPSSTAIS